MKTTIISAILLASVLFAAGAQSRPVDLDGLVGDTRLSPDERAGLLLMREEEKLARDVYARLSEIWGLQVFENIARSEQAHMDRMADLLAVYGIDDPVSPGVPPGVFADPALGELYDELVARGETSLENALEVGRDIEVLDIRDLENLLEGTDREAVQLVYGNLLKGSRNHLNAFERQLSMY